MVAEDIVAMKSFKKAIKGYLTILAIISTLETLVATPVDCYLKADLGLIAVDRFLLSLIDSTIH